MNSPKLAAKSALLSCPVILLVFNRPEYTARVFAEVAKARPSKLLVVADGPRTEAEAKQCAEVRAIVEQVDWECEVLSNYADGNLGCRTRVSSGITWAFSHVEEAIILEDDCLPDPSFFSYCQQMLERYRDDERIMIVSGTSYMADRLDIPESYTFSEFYAIWGWATWRRAWAKFDVTMKNWPKFKAQNQIAGLRPDEHVARVYVNGWDQQDVMDSWAYPWAYSCMFNHALSIVPKVNLVSNVGVYGKHHQGNEPTLNMPSFSLNTDEMIHPDMVFPDIRYDGPLRANSNIFPLPAKPEPTPPLYRRALRKLWRLTFGRLKLVLQTK